MNQIETNCPTYDVTGTTFDPMTTSLASEGIIPTALEKMQLKGKAIQLRVDTPLLYRMRKCDLVDTVESQETVHGLLLADKPKIKGGGIYESEFLDSSGNVIGRITTREH